MNGIIKLGVQLNLLCVSVLYISAGFSFLKWALVSGGHLT